MSHSMGIMCVLHRTVLVTDYCPERGCPGKHGFVVESCRPPCPQHPESQPLRRRD